MNHRVHHSPETKKLSMERHRQDETIPVKVKKRLSADKILTTVFWGARDVYVDFLLEQKMLHTTFNS